MEGGHEVTNAQRKQISDLLASLSPADLARLVAASASEAGMDEVVFPTEWEGRSEETPTVSQTGKSLKYEAVGYAEDSSGVKHKVLVVAYVPPTVARESLSFTATLSGDPTEGRTPKRRKA